MELCRIAYFLGLLWSGLNAKGELGMDGRVEWVVVVVG